MNNEEVKEKNKFIAKGQEGKQKTTHKTFKSKVEGLDDAVFESGAVKHAAQFTKTHKEIAKYVKTNTTVM